MFDLNHQLFFCYQKKVWGKHLQIKTELDSELVNEKQIILVFSSDASEIQKKNFLLETKFYFLNLNQHTTGVVLLMTSVLNPEICNSLLRKSHCLP